MASKTRRLGKGIDALLSSNQLPAQSVTPAEPAAPAEVSDGTLKHLPIEHLQVGKFQPRRDMDPAKLEELSQSIKSQGVMQPIVVRPNQQGGYEIVAGERRWRAAQIAGLDTLPALVREIDDRHRALSTRFQRRPLFN